MASEEIVRKKESPPSRSKLDFCSEDFDPLEALYTPGLVPPCPSAKPLDNISKCRHLLNLEQDEQPPQKPNSEKSQKSSQAISRHQRLINMEKRLNSERRIPIFVSILEKLKKKGGPLAAMAKACEERKRIKVLTRHLKGIRGELLGFLKAVDQHFNMLLSDVDETYKVRILELRTIKQKTDPKNEETKEKFFPKQEKRVRHLQQVFLRGENVVLVSLGT